MPSCTSRVSRASWKRPVTNKQPLSEMKVSLPQFRMKPEEK